MKNRWQVLDLFSGIGGFSLGLERAGMKTVAFCEIDPYARAVLGQHWTGIPIYGDIKHLAAATLASAGISPNVICGGFPCQDISLAGKGAGLAGERSGLWREYHRLIAEIRPAWVIIENVAVLRSRGLDTILRQLAALGYDAEWHCIPASAVGAPHQRDRIWIIAYSRGQQYESARSSHERTAAPRFSEAPSLADSDSGNTDGRRCALQMGRLALAREIAADGNAGRTQWGTEPNVGRVAHGVPARVDRLKCLGNAIVPQIAELIGRAIIAADTFRG